MAQFRVQGGVIQRFTVAAGASVGSWAPVAGDEEDIPDIENVMINFYNRIVTLEGQVATLRSLVPGS